MTKGALEDSFAYEEFRKLVEKFKIKKIIETGTYHGWSTIKLAEFGVPVESVEYVNDNLNVATENVKSSGFNNIKLHLGSSPTVLDKIIEPNEDGLMLFLDAHWYNYWPIHDELKVCISKNIKPVIVIHDFFVPDDNGNAKFGFDQYANQRLDFNYIKHLIDELYNNQYDYHYTTQVDCVDSGLIYIYPKKNA